MVHFLSPSSLNSELVIWLWILLGCLLGLGFFVWGLCCFFFFPFFHLWICFLFYEEFGLRHNTSKLDRKRKLL